MTLSPATRRRLYREGKRMLGPDRMDTLRRRGRELGRQLHTLRARGSRARSRLRPAPWITVTRALRVDASTLFVAGRLDADGEAGSGDADLAVVLADGHEIRLGERLHRYVDRRAARVGGGESAFAALCDVAPEDVPSALRLRTGDGRERVRRCPAPEAAPDALARTVALLDTLGACVGGHRALLDAVLGPAVERAWRAREAVGDAHPPAGAELVAYNGTLAPTSPAVTIVVPLYGRHDYMSYQIARFAQDPELRAAEILYVLDDPRLGAAVRSDAAALARAHEISFSVLYLPRNLGYAGANNAAVALARGRSLLLLNSDVLPLAAGWLGRMLEAGGARPAERVIGARLLYEDGTVQHDGMRFEAAERFEGLWLNRHPGKGLPAELFDRDEVFAPREAVTGACLLVSRERYLGLGGLDEAYLLGDYEDSDFCLKARRAGMSVGIAPRAALCHLERQSQSLVTSAGWKERVTHYNCWLHSRRWHDDIVALKKGA